MTTQQAFEPIPVRLPVADLTQEKIDLIKATVAVDATDLELDFFLHRCRTTGLDPLARQIHFVKRGGKAVIQTGIDGFRLIAARTEQYAGSDDPIYDTEDGAHPNRATVTVWRFVGGERCAFTATARWAEYAPLDEAGELRGSEGFMWRKMPYLMIAKCAESLALRKAFPQELSGLYTDEEMHQAGPPDPRGRQLAAQARTEVRAAPTRPQNAGADLTATQPQVRAIYAFGKGAGLDEEAVERECMDRYEGRAPADLTRRQASELIDALKALPKVSA